MNPDQPDFQSIGILLVMLFGPILLAYKMFMGWKSKNESADSLRKNERAREETGRIAVEKATEEAAAEKEQALKVHDADISDLIRNIDTKYVEARDDGAHVNEFLKDAGDQVRGKKP